MARARRRFAALAGDGRFFGPSGSSQHTAEDRFCFDGENGCTCVESLGSTGTCSSFSCCYTYDGGTAGPSCSCNIYTGSSRDGLIASEDGTKVDHCPPDP